MAASDPMSIEERRKYRRRWSRSTEKEGNGSEGDAWTKWKRWPECIGRASRGSHGQASAWSARPGGEKEADLWSGSTGHRCRGAGKPRLHLRRAHDAEAA